MKVLTTGITGTIGRHLPDSVQPLNLDLAAFPSAKSFSDISSDDHFLHLAGVVGTIEVEKDKNYSHAVNVNGATLLAEEFFKRSSGKFYYISTSHVYGSSSEKITENALTKPSSLYAEQKLMAESRISEIFASAPERLCIIRVFSVLDWDVAPFTLGGAVRKLTQPDSKFQLNHSDDVRDFMTPKTIAKSIFEIAKSDKLDGIVNLCTGTGIRVGEAAIRMLDESGYKIPSARILPGISANPYVVGDNSKLLSTIPDLRLDWQPSKSA